MPTKLEKLLESMPRAAYTGKNPGLDYENPDPNRPKGCTPLTWEERRKYSAETGDYPPIGEQTEYCERVRNWKNAKKASNSRKRGSDDDDDPTEF